MVDLLRLSVRFLRWALAVGFLAVTVVIGTRVTRGPRDITGTGDGSLKVDVNLSLPPSVPSRVVSLPVLFFDDGKEVRVGHPATYIAALLGRGSETGRYEVDVAEEGERLTRFYEYRGRRFALVFALSESHTDPDVRAIYLEE